MEQSQQTRAPFPSLEPSTNETMSPADQISLFGNTMDYSFLGDPAFLEMDQGAFPDLAFAREIADGNLSPFYFPLLTQVGSSPGTERPEPSPIVNDQLPRSGPSPSKPGVKQLSQPRREDLKRWNLPSSPPHHGRSELKTKPSPGQSHFAVRESPPSPRPSKPARKGRTPRSPESSKDSGALVPGPRAAHSEVERRYRDNLNDKILQLHLALVAIKTSSWDLQDSFPRNASSSASSPQTAKVRKAEVMTNAINYVQQTELEIPRMDEEIKKLRKQIDQILEQFARKNLLDNTRS